MNFNFGCIHILTLICFVFVKNSRTEYQCSAPGKFADSVNRSKYHECHLVGVNKFTYFQQSCPITTCFDPVERTCDPEHCDSEMMFSTEFRCQSPGKFPHVDPSRKGSYYKCITANGKFYLYEYQCLPTKACFNYAKQACQVCNV